MKRRTNTASFVGFMLALIAASLAADHAVPQSDYITLPLEIPVRHTVVQWYELPMTDPTNTYEYIIAERNDDRELMASLLPVLELEFDSGPSFSTSFSILTNSRTYTDGELDCLAKNIYWEARNQSTKGQVGIALVTLNRLHHERYPNAICDVVYQRAQFSWYWDGLSDRPKDHPAFIRAMLIVSAMLSPDMNMIDFTNGSTHYHADPRIPAYAAVGFKTPSWTVGMIMEIQVETHLYYRYVTDL